ncbi:MAG: GNAT family N-acetyltransferase, partial [archaeon]|nr:GNAT family N-acetyltransferase [archaeon]
KLKINEIRFREIGFQFRDKLPKEKISQNLKLKITKYKSGWGIEYFLEFVNKKNILFGLLRLRINPNQESIVRELHVYGKSLAIGAKAKNEISQHRGLGKLLMKEAEKIAKKEKAKKISVISGVGVRQYYRKLGYVLENEYMVKKI